MSRVMRNKTLVRHLAKSGIVKNQRDLGEKMGYNNESAFSQVINEKVIEPKDFIAKLKTIEPNLNENWLRTGVGEMLIKPAVMTAIDDDGNVKVEINTGNEMLCRTMPRAKALNYIRTGKLDLNKYRVSKIGDGKMVEVTPIKSDVTEAEIVSAEVIEEIREKVKEEIREEVKEEIKQEEAIAIIPVDIANQVDVDIKKYIEENESELKKLAPSDLTGDVDGVEEIRKDSMSPVFVAGDKIFIKFLKHKTHIVDGEVYYFNLRNRPTMIRQVKIEGDNLRLIAFNSQYSDIVTDFNNVLRVADVNGMYRSFFSNQSVRRKKDEQIDKLIDQNQEALSIIKNLIEKK